ncbi:FAD-dependent monooxygenase [Klebsiella michiganensis]|uniref:FAD-dependent oxidoreductase n=1 Tax=Klebsiella michiganensis TaxID=1134687 RepID=UPI001CCD36DC|nr:NAD(P)/FAD-dependent oxidoreductase [Klebsiella michiganensis]MBZ7436788.1 FAD-dependent monooxygenase [Klebsiella michiganensis]
MNLTVTIAGGGLSGLMLARILHVYGIPAIIYEAEPSPEARRQGGQLDIHESSGQYALQEAGLSDEFRAIIHRGGGATRILSPQGVVLFDRPDNGMRPEVLRGDLRQILIDSLPAGTLQWGKKLTEIRPYGDGRHALTFADGSTAISQLLVGADGAWSKVRRLVSDARPAYTGITLIETFLHEVDTRHPEAASAVGPGSMYCMAPGTCLIAHREAGSIIHTYAQLKRPQRWVEDIDFTDVEIARRRILQEFPGWEADLTALITAGDTPLIPRPIYSLPDEHRWPRVPGVTLIGDAAHLMAPNGSGANLGMLDAVQLGKFIAANADNLDAALGMHEKEMFLRSKAEAAETHVAIDYILGENAPHALIAFFQAVDGE